MSVGGDRPQACALCNKPFKSPSCCTCEGEVVDVHGRHVHLSCHHGDQIRKLRRELVELRGKVKSFR